MDSNSGCLLTLLIIIGLFLLPRPSDRPRTVYPVTCSGSLSTDGTECQGRIVKTAASFQIRADFSNQRVVINREGVLSQLGNCTVFSDKEWVCVSGRFDSYFESHHMRNGQYVYVERDPTVPKPSTTVLFVPWYQWWWNRAVL
jgi:hypothetical protein